ncbi:MAG: hypothetical protein ABII25_00405 [bacterium]
MKINKEKIILDLCGGTGSWSKPYKEARYDVRLVTIPKKDVSNYKPPKNVYGILAAPPCTMFSFARTNAKTMRDFKIAMETVYHCLRIIWECQYQPVSNNAKYTRLKFWTLENPYFGLLKNFIGKPAFTFDPYEFGDNYKKRTSLWGNFNDPKKSPIKMSKEMLEKCKTNSRPLLKFDSIKSKDIHPKYFGKLDRQARRSITPQGFAQAFFQANQ